MKDRSREFFACVESLQLRQEQHQLLHKVKTKSEFTKASALISKQINDTLMRLQKLTTLAKKKSMFEDKPAEINELIYIIKQDIAKINHQISQLSEYLQNQRQDNTQVKSHSHNVITSLQSKLASTSDVFKAVLKTRSDNLKLQKERRDQYGTDNFGRDNSSSPLYNPERLPQSPQPSSSKAQTPSRMSSFHEPQSHSYQWQQQQPPPPPPTDTVIDFGTSFTQQMLVDPDQSSSYMQQREQTIESIESTISELGQVYSRFASVLAEQREMVQRIDDNIGNVHDNVEGIEKLRRRGTWAVAKILSRSVFQ